MAENAPDRSEPISIQDTHLDQNWKGMSGAVAWHLIERHAEGWKQVGDMMEAWLEANKS